MVPVNWYLLHSEVYVDAYTIIKTLRALWSFLAEVPLPEMLVSLVWSGPRNRFSLVFSKNSRWSFCAFVVENCGLRILQSGEWHWALFFNGRICPPAHHETLGKSGNIFGCHNCGERVLLASRRKIPGMHRTATPHPITRTYLSQDINNGDKAWVRGKWEKVYPVLLAACGSRREGQGFLPSRHLWAPACPARPAPAALLTHHWRGERGNFLSSYLHTQKHNRSVFSFHISAVGNPFSHAAWNINLATHLKGQNYVLVSLRPEKQLYWSIEKTRALLFLSIFHYRFQLSSQEKMEKLRTRGCI